MFLTILNLCKLFVRIYSIIDTSICKKMLHAHERRALKECCSRYHLHLLFCLSLAFSLSLCLSFDLSICVAISAFLDLSLHYLFVYFFLVISIAFSSSPFFAFSSIVSLCLSLFLSLSLYPMLTPSPSFNRPWVNPRVCGRLAAS